MNLRYNIFLIILFIPLKLFAVNITDIYHLNYISESQAMGAIKPFIEADTTVNPYAGKVIINGPASNVNTIVEILRSVDVQQKNWQITTYIGNSPPGYNGEITYSTSDSDKNNLYSIKAVNGAEAQIQISKVVRQISNISGVNSTTGEVVYQDDTNTAARATLQNQIVVAEQKVATDQEAVDTFLQDNPGANASTPALIALNNTLEASQNNLQVLESEMGVYTDSLSNIKSNKNTSISGGSVDFQYTNLPQYLYVTPYAKGNLVQLVIREANSQVNLNDETTSRAINTTVMAEPGQWTLVYGSDPDSQSSYTISTEQSSTKARVWIKCTKSN